MLYNNPYRNTWYHQIIIQNSNLNHSKFPTVVSLWYFYFHGIHYHGYSWQSLSWYSLSWYSLSWYSWIFMYSLSWYSLSWIFISWYSLSWIFMVFCRYYHGIHVQIGHGLAPLARLYPRSYLRFPPLSNFYLWALVVRYELR